MSRNRHRKQARAAQQTAAPQFEALEPRLLLSADGVLTCITRIEADNRGLIELRASNDLNSSTVNSDNIRVFLAGPDGLLGTADDQLRSASVTYNAARRRIIINADVPAAERYRVVVEGDNIRDVNGRRLDGEFNAPGEATGDGRAGGQLEFFTTSGPDTIVRFTTVAGDIDVLMFPDETPLTVENFFSYMNEGSYDNTFIHRSAVLGDGTPFVVQGGGFAADGRFTPIEQRDPVLNEPGITNSRGTIAMAKLGGNPNSATTQWFFNLSDNADILDDQNGGFTVFGRIVDGLDVMDALADFEVINASDIGGALNELPVLDAQAVEDRDGNVVAADLIRIERIAQQLDITGEPFRQITTDGLVTLTDGGSAIVNIYSLTGVQLGTPSDFVRVTFGAGGNTIQRIAITGDLEGPIGIQITGADNVGSIVDLRRDVNSDINFIVSDARIANLNLKGDVTGFNLNGVLLANNVLLAEDIDGDMDFEDNTGVLVLSGDLYRINLQGDLSGDVIVQDGGVRSVNVRGDTTGADIRTGTSDFVPSTSLRFQGADQVRLDIGTPVSSIRADSWTSNGQRTATIEAPSLRSIRISGDFEGNLDVQAGQNQLDQQLGPAFVGGDLLNSNWRIFGSTSVVRITGNAVNWFFGASGNVASITARAMSNVELSFSGRITRLTTGEFLNSSLSANSVIIMRLTGQRDTSGDFSGVLSVGFDNVATRSFIAAGDLNGAEMDFEAGVNTFRVRGDIDGSTLNLNQTIALLFNNVTNTDLNLTRARQVVADNWVGGSIVAQDLSRLTISGDARSGLDGDFLADMQIAGLRRITIAGDMQSEALLRDVPAMRVGGDVVDSRLFFTQTIFARNAIADLHISGMVDNSLISVQGNAESVSVGALYSSQLFFGTNSEEFGFPANGAAFSTAVTAEFVEVRGMTGMDFGMVESFIMGGTIEYVRVMEPDTNNSGIAFGVAGHDLQMVDSIIDGQGRRVTNPQAAPTPVGDFQIRPGFGAPLT
ncbi:MAG: peptidylprolyl isomerase [Planctomycetota bacterium]